MRIWDLDSGDCCFESGVIEVLDLNAGECIQLEIVKNIIPVPSKIYKAGTLPAGAFSGNPKSAAVVFDFPFNDTSYVISITGEDARIFTYQTKLATGFVINSNANGALAGEVSWTATVVGES